MKEENLIRELEGHFQRNRSGILYSEIGGEGYWSNLDKSENEKLLYSLDKLSPREAVSTHQAWLYDVIFSPKREAGLELLELEGTETCIDYGCMWGALTIGIAKRAKFVLGIDQTKESLIFLKHRLIDEGIDNVELICADIRNFPDLHNKIDVAVVNGVLEWIPEDGVVELKKYYGKYEKKQYNQTPVEKQKGFLKKVFTNLKNGGRLYLAIENRYDFKVFLGQRDPHSNLFFTSFLPRKISNYISMGAVGRPYVNWLYSFNNIESLLYETGFSRVELYACFPDYRFPERIMPYDRTFSGFMPTISARDANGKIKVKRLFGRVAETLFFKILRAKFFSPSIIAIACK